MKKLNSQNRNHFSLKSLVKDIVTISTAPIKIAASSITGKPTNIEYETGVGKVVGGAVDTGNRALNITAKAFADTVTGGLATKAANLIRDDEYKEKAYSYGEQKELGTTGIKFIDAKVAEPLGKTAAVAGGLAGAAALLSGAKSAMDKLKKGSNSTKLIAGGTTAAGVSGAASSLGKDDELYEQGQVPGDVPKDGFGIDDLAKQVLDSDLAKQKGSELLERIINGNEDTGIPSGISSQDLTVDDGHDYRSNQKTGMFPGFGPEGDSFIVIVIIFVILLIILTGGKK